MKSDQFTDWYYQLQRVYCVCADQQIALDVVKNLVDRGYIQNVTCQKSDKGYGWVVYLDAYLFETLGYPCEFDLQDLA